MFLLQKFLFFVLKSSDVLDILVPILYYLNDARADQCESHPGDISVFAHSKPLCSFILLLMSVILVFSPRGPHAHRRVHFAAAERGEKLWCAFE